MKYKQCILEKKVGLHTLRQTTFIPEKFATKGQILKLKSKYVEDEWDDGWQVMSVGATRTGEYIAKNLYGGWKGHRKHTDI